MPALSRRSTLAVLNRLRKFYGPRPPTQWGDGVATLVKIILSQNTSNANSSAGYRQLRRELPTWDSVADAPVEVVERHIRVSGLSNTKAPRIQAILRQLRDRHGKIDLQFVADMDHQPVYEYLTDFNGVGPKTAHCVLMFAFGKQSFPVDTHIHRIAIRLGWIPEITSAEKAHDLLTPAVPPGDRYETHVLLIDHGRQTCKARNPRCGECPILKLCPTGKLRAAGLAENQPRMQTDGHR